MTAQAQGDRAIADTRWARHVATLAVRPDVTLHGPGSSWTARDEYAHLARWLRDAVARVRAAHGVRPVRGGPPAPALDVEHGPRPPAADRALDPGEAYRGAEHARAELFAAVASLRAGAAGVEPDAPCALVTGELVAHLDERFALIVAGMLADEAAGSAALRARLDAAPTATAAPGVRAGTRDRDVYAHLVRWFDFAARSLAAFRAGEGLPDVPAIDEANRRWSEADRSLTLVDARRRAVAGRGRVLSIARSIAPAAWTAAALNRLDGNTVGHYPEHLRDLAGPAD